MFCGQGMLHSGSARGHCFAREAFLCIADVNLNSSARPEMDFFCRTLAPSSQSLGLEDWNCTSGVRKGWKRVERLSSLEKGSGPFILVMFGARCFSLFQEQRSSFNPSEVTQAVTSRDPECIDVVNPKSHYDVLARILLLYAKLNRGVRYVQGMNELLAPLYYLFAQDPLNGHHAEDSRLCYIFLVFVSLNVEPDRIFRSTSHIHHRIFIYDIIRKCKRNSPSPLSPCFSEYKI